MGGDRREMLLENLVDILLRNKTPGLHDGTHDLSQLRSLTDLVAKDIAHRNVMNSVSLDQSIGLGSLSRARGTDDENDFICHGVGRVWGVRGFSRLGTGRKKRADKKQRKPVQL